MTSSVIVLESAATEKNKYISLNLILETGKREVQGSNNFKMNSSR